MRSFQVALMGVMLLAGAAARMPAQDADGQAELDALYVRARALLKAGKLKEAAGVYEQVVEKAGTVFGPAHINTANLMSQLATVYSVLDEPAKAAPVYRRCLAIREAELGKTHLHVAETLASLAKVYQTLQQPDKAEPLLKRSLAITELRQGTDHLDVADAAWNLAVLYRETGQYRKALPFYQRNLSIREAKQGKDSTGAAIAMLHLAALHFTLWQPVKAEELYKRSLAILEDRKELRLVSVALSGLAGVYMAVGQREKAEPLLVRGLKMAEALQGKDNIDVATLTHNLAGVYMVMKQPEKAEPLFQRALAIKEARLGKDHSDVAHTLNALARLHSEQGNLYKAESLLRRALGIWEKSVGKNHPWVAVALDGLANVHESSGKADEAQPLYERSLKIVEAAWGKDHPDTAIPRNDLARLHVQKEDYEEAGRLFDISRRAVRKYIAAILPALSDAEKAAFFEKTSFRSNFEQALALGVKRKDDATLAALSATWLLNGKAVDQEGLASSLLLTRQGGDASLARLGRQLLAVRQRLARLTIALPRPGQEKKRLQEVEDLTAEEQELGKQLRRAGSTAAPPAWIELSDLRKALPAERILIDVARFTVSDFAPGKKKKPGPIHYAAWITAKSGPVQVVDLGSAEKIDEAVKLARSALQESAAQIKAKGEEKAEQTLRERLEAVSKLVLHPLLPHLGASKHLSISPDGALWLMPWEALPLGDGKYAVEKYRISYLTSGRDRLLSSVTKVKPGVPLVLADPDFDLDVGNAERRQEPGEDEEATRSLVGTLGLGKVRRLLGAGAEARAVVPSLKEFAGIAPRVYLREKALTSVFKSARSPRVLVLCTHGFFLPARDAAGKWENPLLRCGLLLAGCNKPEGGEGVLTGLEVVGTDLRGCELVVLSACETGVGDVQSGEGVAGLRQAFQLAGAKAVVSTLWSVPDKSSARLMALFFRNLGKGQTKAEALRGAQLKIIAERRDDFAAAHPFFWAAYTLTGR